MSGKDEGNVTCLVLRRLVEAAWDEGDLFRLFILSAAMDRYMLEKTGSAAEKIQAV